MSGICGWFGDLERAESSSATLERMARHLTIDGDGDHKQRATYEAALAARGHPPNIHLQTERQLWAACEGRPYWTEPKLARTAGERGNAAALIDGYRRHGPDFLNYLHGHFACAVLDFAAGSALLAIDRMGVRPLCYADAGVAGIVFGSTTDSVRMHPKIDATVSPQAVFNFLYFYRVPGPRTIYAEQRKLLAGQCVLFEKGKGFKTRFYSPIPYVEGDSNRIEQLGDQLKDVLRQSFDRTIAGETFADLGAFLSGGLDSSTVSGLYSQVSQGHARTFTIGFENELYDETRYARIAARHFNTKHYEYFISMSDILDVLEGMASVFDEPFANTSAIAVYYCASLARANGCSVMLAGDGGDEIFAGNSRYVNQRIFDAYFHVPKHLRHSVIEPLVFALPDGKYLRNVRRLQNFIRRANTPLPDRLEFDNIYGAIPVQDMLCPDIAGEVDPEEPLDILRELYHRPPEASSLKRMMHVDMQLTIADGDLRKVNRMCELAGVRVLYPLLDDDLVRFAAAVPSGLLIRNSVLRYFYKKALSDFLPKEAIAKQKHGFGLPDLEALSEYEPLRAMAYDCATALKNRHLLSSDFLNGIVDLHRRCRDATAANILWDVLLLELWFRKHVDEATAWDA